MQQAITPQELPSAALLTNGRYDLLVEADGSGHAAYEGRLITTRFGRGTVLYLQEEDRIWSASVGTASAGGPPAEVASGPGMYRMRRTVDDVAVTTDISVAPDRDAELRRFVVKNAADRRRHLTLTVVTELLAEGRTVTTVRTAGGIGASIRDGGAEIHLLHAFAGGETIAVETDGSRMFDGGGASAKGLADGLTGSTGTFEQPILALQIDVTLEAGAERALTWVGCAGRSASDAAETLEALSTKGALADAFLEAALREQGTRDRLKLGPRNADRYHRVGAALLRGGDALRGAAKHPAERAPGILRSVGLDPSQPLVICRISDEGDMPLARLVLKANAFWRTLGLSTQILFLNDKSGAAADGVQRRLHELIELSEGAAESVVLRHADVIAPADQKALTSSADLVLSAEQAGVLRVDR